MQILDSQGNPIDLYRMDVTEPFSLKAHSQDDINKLRDEVLDKVKDWESGMSNFFSSYDDYANSWRVRSTIPPSNKPRGLSNSKSGETHRATETLATAWFRMLTANDPFFEATILGIAPDGREYTEADLFRTEALIGHQLRKLQFKSNLLTGLTSMGLLGTVIFEEPWIARKDLSGINYLEGTGFVLRPLIQTGFDLSCYDVSESDYIFTVDYPSKSRIKSMIKNDVMSWDKSMAEDCLKDINERHDNKGSSSSVTEVYARIESRKSRAGYSENKGTVCELIDYHGKIDSDNPIVQDYWERNGFPGDPADYDFTIGILEGGLAKIHVTQYGSWHTKFKCAHYKKFELEPLAYGVGQLANRAQKMLDVADRRAADLLMFALYNPMKLGKFSGLKPSDLRIRPNQVLEMEDISQLEALKPDVQAIAQALGLRQGWVEDLRGTTGATANLQAIATGATATESGITQSEGIRSVGVHAEIVAETLLGEHIEQCHVNNLNHLDEGIWVALAGSNKPQFVNKNMLPANVGFLIKPTTDKDFRPERSKKILEGIQVFSSVRNVFDPRIAVNATQNLTKEFFRSLGLNPRDLDQELTIPQMLQQRLKMMQQGGMPPPGGVDQSVSAEASGDPLGAGSNLETPVGPVPTSPLPQNLQPQMA